MEDGVDPALENDWSLLPFMALSDGAHAYERKVRNAGRTLLIVRQNHRRLFLFHPSSCRDLDASSHILVRHLMYPPDGRGRPDRSTGRCHQEYGTERGGGHRGQPAILWAVAREIVHGHKGVVRAEVSKVMVRRGRHRRWADRGRRDFTDTEILKVGQWVGPVRPLFP